jgi:hypothetical protein
MKKDPEKVVLEVQSVDEALKGKCATEKAIEGGLRHQCQRGEEVFRLMSQDDEVLLHQSLKRAEDLIRGTAHRFHLQHQGIYQMIKFLNISHKFFFFSRSRQRLSSSSHASSSRKSQQRPRSKERSRKRSHSPQSGKKLN